MLIDCSIRSAFTFEAGVLVAVVVVLRAAGLSRWRTVMGSTVIIGDSVVALGGVSMTGDLAHSGPVADPFLKDPYASAKDSAASDSPQPSAPQRAYTYCSGASAIPFPGSDNGFSMGTAWWLAETSLLRYADEAFVSERWAEVGVEQVGVFRGGGTVCHVVSTDRWVIVSVRGVMVLRKGEGTTLPDVLQEWKSHAKITLVNWNPNGAVHQGFAMALDEVWWGRQEQPGVKAWLDSNTAGPAQRSVWFTGHGLGAALATLAASRYGRATGLYTFGSPHVGDRAFAGSFGTPADRFVNASDPVPSFLASFGHFEHVGTLKYIRTDGSIVDGPVGVQRLGDWCRRLTAGDGRGVTAFAHHAPVSYAIRIWNACIQSYRLGLQARSSRS